MGGNLPALPRTVSDLVAEYEEKSTAILPATAHYDHGELTGDWRDLPVASFTEAGTNVPTGLLRMRRAA